MLLHSVHLLQRSSLIMFVLPCYLKIKKTNFILEDTKGLLRIIHENNFDHRQIQCMCLKEEKCVYSHRSYNSPPPHTGSILHWYNMSCKLHSCTSQLEALQLYPSLYCLTIPCHTLPEARRQSLGTGTKCCDF